VLFTYPEKLREFVLPQVIRRLVQIVLSTSLTIVPTSDLNQSDIVEQIPLDPNRHNELFEEFDLLPDNNVKALDSCENDTCQYG